MGKYSGKNPYIFPHPTYIILKSYIYILLYLTVICLPIFALLYTIKSNNPSTTKIITGRNASLSFTNTLLVVEKLSIEL